MAWRDGQPLRRLGFRGGSKGNGRSPCGALLGRGRDAGSERGLPAPCGLRHGSGDDVAVMNNSSEVVPRAQHLCPLAGTFGGLGAEPACRIVRVSRLRTSTPGGGERRPGAVAGPASNGPSRAGAAVRRRARRRWRRLSRSTAGWCRRTRAGGAARGSSRATLVGRARIASTATSATPGSDVEVAEQSEAALDAGGLGQGVGRGLGPRFHGHGAVGLLASQARALDAAQRSGQDGRGHQSVLGGRERTLATGQVQGSPLSCGRRSSRARRRRVRRR
jgi:hypothetical protein